MEQTLLIKDVKTLPTEAEIQNWIVAYLAKLLEVDTQDIEITVPFDRYGLDSSIAFGLIGDLEDWLGTEIEATLFYYYPTVEAVVQYLNSQLNANNEFQ